MSALKGSIYGRSSKWNRTLPFKFDPWTPHYPLLPPPNVQWQTLWYLPDNPLLYKISHYWPIVMPCLWLLSPFLFSGFTFLLRIRNSWNCFLKKQKELSWTDLNFYILYNVDRFWLYIDQFWSYMGPNLIIFRPKKSGHVFWLLYYLPMVHIHVITMLAFVVFAIFSERLNVHLLVQATFPSTALTIWVHFCFIVLQRNASPLACYISLYMNCSLRLGNFM